jgi:hypothetical protein
MFNPLSKMNVSTLGLDADLLEAAKKVKCMENDPYNPSGAGPANLPSEPNGSLPDAMTNKINIADEKKKKVKKEDADLYAKPGYNKKVRGYE